MMLCIHRGLKKKHSKLYNQTPSVGESKIAHFWCFTFDCVFIGRFDLFTIKNRPNALTFPTSMAAK
ncbi:hypothetical protein ACX11_05685 [Vibrio parahaemolyticus]|nr:hypothetical protein ACX11_05685 [Vibrio parahaemolyticus]